MWAQFGARLHVELPEHLPQVVIDPILRFADTVIGVAVGLAVAWVGLRLILPRIEPSD
jgi:uncharacterized membrane protein YccC